ncbi:MAG TPA: hypothetical protein VNM87_12240 [Candidatus Udaeobacter sp.]|nr:hypothetical protein [Candidatus Udaeobacter sp.]
MTTRAALSIAAVLCSLFTPLSSQGAIPLPLSAVPGFVPNRGQAPAEVLYYGAIPGGVIYLTREAVVLDTWRTERPARLADNPDIRRVGRAVWLRFSAANPSAILAGDTRLNSRLNFLIGPDRTQWHADVPVFQRPAIAISGRGSISRSRSVPRAALVP